MTVLDLIVLLLVGGAAIFGVLRGFVAELVSLAAWVGAVLAVKLFHAPVAGWLADRGTVGAGAEMLAFAGIFVVVLIGGKLLAGQLGGAARRSRIGGFDRVLGGGFGLLKGLIGATLFFLFARLLFDAIGGAEQPGWIVDARTYPLLNASSRALVDMVEGRGA